MRASAVISFSELGLTPSDVYASMGYRGGVEPDPQTCSLVLHMLTDLEREVKPAYALRIFPGKVENHSVVIEGTVFDTPKTIGKILQGAHHFALFIVTAGQVYDEWADRVKQQGDILCEFVADAIGSATVEKMGLYAKKQLEKRLNGTNHSSSFCPGQYHFPISEQSKLFALMGEDNLGVTINDSYLMHPIKSVSGIIGIGETLDPKITACSLCPRVDCFRRNAGHA